MSAQATAGDVLAGGARSAFVVGPCLASLEGLPAGCAQTCVTSPPYWGLRDYGGARWEGGADGCEHEPSATVTIGNNAAVRGQGETTSRLTGGTSKPRADGHQRRVAAAQATCLRCGASRSDDQIGQERTLQEYVERMVAVFREVRRVLADDGTLWLNLGDSYAGSWGAQSRPDGDARSPVSAAQIEAAPKRARTGAIPSGSGLKPKDLVGIPWRVALALQADGWWLRSDIVWAKPNPMPESVTDRPTRAHEYVFLLTKSERYFYNADAIREASQERPAGNGFDGRQGGARDAARTGGVGSAEPWTPGGGRNARDVWTITPEPYDGAHFATMPPEIARRCIVAGSRRGDVVLDPFAGAGTTALVAVGNGRRSIGCELNPAYADLARARVAEVDTSVAEPVRCESPAWGALFDAAGAP